jgi:hypothetical protein
MIEEILEEIVRFRTDNAAVIGAAPRRGVILRDQIPTAMLEPELAGALAERSQVRFREHTLAVTVRWALHFWLCPPQRRHVV